MCQEVWYRYTCGHLGARPDQEGWNHCNAWNEGQAELACPNCNPDAEHDSRADASKCQECQYVTPPTSDESSSGGSEEE